MSGPTSGGGGPGAAAGAPVPAGTRLVADRGLRRLQGGRVLVGGSPLRLLRLTDAGAAVVADWLAGAPLGAGPTAARLARRLLDAGLVHPRPVPGGTGAPGPSEVTAVVPVRDDPAGLAETLDALAGPDRPRRVVVVDDGSVAPLRLEGGPARAGIDLVRRGGAGGPAAARNTGLALVATPLVAFLDAGVVAGPGWLGPVLAHFEDPAVGAVAPRVRSTSGPSLLERYERLRSPLDLGDEPARVAPGSRVSYVPTAALVVRRSALAEVGGFDEALRFGEDVDLVWRLVGAGWTVRYEPGAEVDHRPRRTWAAWAHQRVGYGSSAGPLARRHPGALAPVRVSAWSAAAWALVAARRPVLGLAVAAASAALLPRRLTVLDRAWPASLRLAGTGHLGAGRLLGAAVTRAWWPVAVVAAATSRRSRLVVAAAVVVPPLLERRAQPGPERLDPVRHVVLRLADDVAYGTGLWRGAVAARTPAPLVPDLGSWPGRGGRGAVSARSGDA